MKLSIVTTMYYSAPYLQEFYERIKKSAEKVTDNYEIIFVDDGSPDKSLDLAVQFHQSDPHVKVIELSRNFGHHKAIMCGLEHATGKFVFLIDCDLEESPELLNHFWNELENKSCDVVYGVQKHRDDKLMSRFFGSLYYHVVNALSPVKIPHNLTTVRLMSKSYVKSLLKFIEREINIAHLWVTTGYNQVEIEVDKKKKDTTTYNLHRKLSIVINSIVSFSDRPLYYLFIFGFIVSFISFLYSILLIVRHFFFSVAVEGWVSIMISIWFSCGLIMLSIGVLGVYLSKIFVETKQRPRVIIKEIYKTSDLK